MEPQPINLFSHTFNHCGVIMRLMLPAQRCRHLITANTFSGFDMQNRIVSVLLSLLFLATSCSTSFADKEIDAKLQPLALTPQQNAERALDEVARTRLAKVQELIKAGNLRQAADELAPLEQLDLFKLETAALQDQIETAGRQQQQAINTETTRRTMLAETVEATKLPTSYGQTVVINAKLNPLKMPTSEMEKLVNKKISIVQPDGIGVKELVNLLNKDGLNVVADEELNESGKKIMIKVKDVTVRELFGYIAQNLGVDFHIGENMVWITAGENTPGAKLETRIIRLRQGSIPEVPASGGGNTASKSGFSQVAATDQEEDKDLEEALTAFFADSPAGSSFKIFRNRNVLVVRNTREGLRLVEELVEELDRPPYQVSIEARFITITQDDLRDLGVELTKVNGGRDGETLDPRRDNNTSNVSNFFTEFGTLAAGAESGVGAMTLSGVIGNRTFDMLISALEKKASTVTLSAPKVTVLNNRTARIRKGDLLYYFEEYDIESVDNGDQAGTSQFLVPTGSPVELPLGITFDVKVNIGNDGKTVLLGLRPSIVDFLNWETYTTGGGGGDSGSSNLTPIKLPRTHEQALTTSVGVSSGETVVLGGLVTSKESSEVKQVPFLGSLPLVGILFRHTVDTKTPTNLLIFVTATVLNDRGEKLDVRLLPDDIQP